MKDYEIISAINNLKKRVLLIRIFTLVITIISVYLIFKKQFLIGFSIFFIGIIITGIIGLPAQSQLRKLNIELNEINNI